MHSLLPSKKGRDSPNRKSRGLSHTSHMVYLETFQHTGPLITAQDVCVSYKQRRSVFVLNLENQSQQKAWLVLGFIKEDMEDGEKFIV